MTVEEFGKLRPGKSLLKTKVNYVESTVLLKFFTVDENGQMSLVTTKDFSNPHPSTIVDGDWMTYYNLCEIVKL